MATILPIMSQQQVPQQFQTQQASGNTQDPLFQALVKHITTGVHSVNTTNNEIQGLIDSYSGLNGGRAYLETLITSSDDKIECSNWVNKDTISGTVQLTATTFKFDATLASFPVSGSGSARGAFKVASVPYAGQIYFNDINAVTQGQISFTAQVKNNTLFINISGGGQLVAVMEIEGFYVNIGPSAQGTVTFTHAQ